MTEHQKRLVEAAQALVRRLDGEKITLTRFVVETGISRGRIYAAFPDGWCALCEAAGIAPLRPYYRLTDDQIFRAMLAAFEAQGGVTTRADFEPHFAYGWNVFARRHLTWRAALVACRGWALANAPDFAYMDRLPETVRPHKPWHRRSDLEKALGERERADGSAVRELGPRIDFRGCVFAPTNEQGVVFLFGAIARDLGFAVESFSSRYPDCEAKVRLGNGGWRPVRIELEFKASNFLLHGHDPKACDILVCWENDWPDAPMPVLELKAEVERLARAEREKGGGGKE
jgi:hypothetical protein